MLKTIRKYKINMYGSPKTLKVPTGAQILHTAMQNGDPYVWLFVDSGVPDTEEIQLELFPTGAKLERPGYAYVNTIMDGDYVWHVFGTVSACFPLVKVGG